jgi:hypothetical protein
MPKMSVISMFANDPDDFSNSPFSPDSVLRLSLGGDT